MSSTPTGGASVVIADGNVATVAVFNTSATAAAAAAPGDLRSNITSRVREAAYLHRDESKVRDGKHVIVMSKQSLLVSGMQVITKREDLVKILDLIDEEGYNYVAREYNAPFEDAKTMRPILLDEFESLDYKKHAFVLVLHPMEGKDSPGIVVAMFVKW